MASLDLIKAIAATAELCGANLSEAAAEMLLADLSAYPEQAVMAALARVRRSGKRFSLGAIIENIETQDGRPGAAAAWAMLPRSESQSVVWTREMAQAWGVARPLMETGDKFGAQRAFTEEYQRLCDEARERNDPVQWEASFGDDPYGREAVVREAIEKGRLPQGAMTLLPAPDLTQSPLVPALAGMMKPMLEGPQELDRETRLANLAKLKEIVSGKHHA